MSIYREMTVLQRIIKRPFEHALALLLITTGIIKLSLGTPLIYDLENKFVADVWASLSFIASVLIIVGLQYRKSLVMARAIERIGHSIAATTILVTGGYAVYILGPDPLVLTGLIDDLILAAASVARFEFLRRESAATIRAREIVSKTTQGS